MSTKQLGNKVDFEKLRRSRRRAQHIKRLFILIAIMIGIGGTVLLNNILVEQSVTTKLSDFIAGMGGSGFPVPVPGGIIRDVKGNGSNLMVLNDTNLYIYSPKGKPLQNIQQMTDNTVMLGGDNMILTYDVGAKRFAVHSPTKTLMTKETEFGITSADMNKKGDFAIVSSSRQYVSEVAVYNRKLSPIYYCYFTEDYVDAVSVSPKGSMLATAWLNSREGALLSGINVYLLSNSEGPAAKVEIPDEWILDLWFISEENIGIITDRSYTVMGAGGDIKHKYDFYDMQLHAVEHNGGQVLLLLENTAAGTQQLILLDNELNEKFAYDSPNKIIDMALSTRQVYILYEDSINIYDTQMNLKKSSPVRFTNTICLADGQLYYLDREEIHILGEKTEEQSVTDLDETSLEGTEE